MESMFIVNSILLWIVVLLNLLLTLALVRRVSSSPLKPADPLPIGLDAPPFKAETPEGKLITLADFDVDKEVALVFVAPTCAPCLDKLPFLNKLYHPAGSAGVTLVLVSDADPEATRAFIAGNDVTVPVLIAPRRTNKFMETYKIMGTPMYCLLDRARKVKASGFLDSEWHELANSWTAA